MRLKSSGWVGENVTRFKHILSTTITIVASLMIWPCDDNDDPPQNVPYQIELEYRRQGDAGITYSCFPMGIAILDTQFRANGIVLNFPGDATKLPLILLRRSEMLQYTKDNGEKIPGESTLKRKRFLFGVKGIYSVSDNSYDCNIGGYTDREFDNTYDCIFYSFVSCGWKAECKPTGSEAFESQSLQFATLHELGHLASFDIPHCVDNRSFHTGAPNSGCVMYSLVITELNPTAAQITCGGFNDPPLPVTYGYCTACQAEVRKKSELWPK